MFVVQVERALVCVGPDQIRSYREIRKAREEKKNDEWLQVERHRAAERGLESAVAEEEVVVAAAAAAEEKQAKEWSWDTAAGTGAGGGGKKLPPIQGQGRGKKGTVIENKQESLL